MIDNSEPENREIKRRISLGDAPKIIRQGDGSQLSEILHWPDVNIGNAIQQLLEAKATERSVQILNSALGDCKQINKVECRRVGNSEMR